MASGWFPALATFFDRKSAAAEKSARKAEGRQRSNIRDEGAASGSEILAAVLQCTWQEFISATILSIIPDTGGTQLRCRVLQ